MQFFFFFGNVLFPNGLSMLYHEPLWDLHQTSVHISDSPDNANYSYLPDAGENVPSARQTNASGVAPATSPSQGNLNTPSGQENVAFAVIHVFLDENTLLL